MVDQLFHGYFEAGLNLSDHDTLVRLADQAGIPPDLATAFLTSQEGIEAVREEEQQGLRLGIRAVPYFYVAGRPGLSGAHPPPVIANWLLDCLTINSRDRSTGRSTEHLIA
jgi:predicted DsbA family dithiol-disulfide isomerase